MWAYSDSTIDDAVAIAGPTSLTVSIESTGVGGSGALSIEAAIGPSPYTTLPIRTYCKLLLIALVEFEAAHGWSSPGLGQYRGIYGFCAEVGDL